MVLGIGGVLLVCLLVLFGLSLAYSIMMMGYEIDFPVFSPARLPSFSPCYATLSLPFPALRNKEVTNHLHSHTTSSAQPADSLARLGAVPVP